ncbi:hypothetical protein WDU94_000568, partial [Cyamophila willieti]
GLDDKGSGSSTNPADQLRHNASNINRLHLNPKKKSGAQRRREGIQRAKERGEPIRYYNLNRRGRTEGNVSTPQKRQRSEGNSPKTPENKTSKKVKQQGASSSSGSNTTEPAAYTYSQAMTQLKMAIVLESYPEEKLSDVMLKSIKTSVTKEIFKANPGELPRFTNYHGEKGILYITCADEASRDWLLAKVRGDLKDCVGAPLRIGPSKEIVKSTKMTTWVSAELIELLGEKDHKGIITLIGLQNPTLPTEDMTVITSHSDTSGTTLVLFVGELGLKELRRMGFKAHLGLTQLTFKLIGKKDTPHTEGPSSQPTT